MDLLTPLFLSRAAPVWDSGKGSPSPFPLLPKQKEAKRVTNPPQNGYFWGTLECGKTQNLHLTAETSTRLGLQVNISVVKKKLFRLGQSSILPWICLLGWFLQDLAPVFLFFCGKKDQSRPTNAPSRLWWDGCGTCWSLNSSVPVPPEFIVQRLKKSQIQQSGYLVHGFDKAEKPMDTVRGWGAVGCRIPREFFIFLIFLKKH